MNTLTAEEVALLSLGAALNIRISEGRQISVNGSSTVDLAEATIIVSRLDKPICCEASLIDSVVSVQCRPLSGFETEALRQRRQLWSIGQGIVATIRGTQPDKDVLIESMGVNGLVSLDELERWQNQFVIQNPFAVDLVETRVGDPRPILRLSSVQIIGKDDFISGLKRQQKRKGKGA